jgi:hypothetical protein
MSRAAAPDRVAAVDGIRRPGGDLFLVEFSAARAADDAADVHHALRYAVRRLAATGAAIRWCSGLFVPAEHRCLFLVQAGGRDVVARARDTAGLSGANVHPVHPLPDRPPSPRPSRSEGRS